MAINRRLPPPSIGAWPNRSFNWRVLGPYRHFRRHFSIDFENFRFYHLFLRNRKKYIKKSETGRLAGVDPKHVHGAMGGALSSISARILASNLRDDRTAPPRQTVLRLRPATLKKEKKNKIERSANATLEPDKSNPSVRESIDAKGCVCVWADEKATLDDRPHHTSRRGSRTPYLQSFLSCRSVVTFTRPHVGVLVVDSCLGACNQAIPRKVRPKTPRVHKAGWPATGRNNAGWTGAREGFFLPTVTATVTAVTILTAAAGRLRLVPVETIQKMNFEFNKIKNSIKMPKNSS